MKRILFLFLIMTSMTVVDKKASRKTQPSTSTDGRWLLKNVMVKSK